MSKTRVPAVCWRSGPVLHHDASRLRFVSCPPWCLLCSGRRLLVNLVGRAFCENSQNLSPVASSLSVAEEQGVPRHTLSK